MTEKLILPQFSLGAWPVVFPLSFFRVFLPIALINNFYFSSVFWEAAEGGLEDKSSYKKTWIWVLPCTSDVSPIKPGMALSRPHKRPLCIEEGPSNVLMDRVWGVAQQLDFMLCLTLTQLCTAILRTTRYFIGCVEHEIR